MNKNEARWRINETLKSRGFSYVGPEPDRYAGSVYVGNTRVQLDITIPDLEFGKAPLVKILNRSDIPLDIIAHIEQGTGLCYGSQNFLRLDKYQPGESILRVIKEAEETLSKSFAGNWKSEISSELPLYWSNIEIQIPHGVKSLPNDCYLHKIHPTSNISTSLILSTKKSEHQSDTREVFIIHVSGEIGANENIITPSTLSDLETWLDQGTLKLVTSFEKVIQQLSAGKIVLFIATNGAVGCSVIIPNKWLPLNSKDVTRRNKTTRRLLLANKSKHQLTHYRGSDTSLAFITQRNSIGDSPTLAGKSIALIGCGTIGSHLARYLVQSGAGHNADFLLVDNELLTAGNLGRHLCNYSDIGEPKALALSNELNRFHPDLQIRPLCSDVTDAWEHIKDADLIIDAVGIEDIGDFLNSKAIDIRKNGNGCAMLHVWLTGNGIGAQSFLNVNAEHACYRCLQPDVGQPARFDMRKDVTKESSVRSPSCGEGAYVPYLVDAPIQAACIALNAVHAYFSQDSYPTLTSKLFDQKNGRNIKDKIPAKSKNCPACGT